MNVYGSTHSETVAEFLRSNKMGIEVFSHPVNLNSDFDEHNTIVAKRIMGMCGVSMHGEFYDKAYASGDPLIVEVVKKRFIQAVQAAQFHNINHLIFHSAFRTYYGAKGSSVEKWYIKASIDFWKDFEKNIPDGMTVLLENVEDNTPEVFAEIVYGINSLKICCCFDVAHAHVYSSAPLNEWIQALGGKIKHVHLSDNDGKDDLHLPLGKGNLPLVNIIHDILNQVNKDIPFTLECDIRASVDWLKNNVQIGQK